MYYTDQTRLKGISQTNRQRLVQLHREQQGPFTVEAAMDTLGLERSQAQRLLAHLAAQGWLVRVQHGLYATVPLESAQPAQWRVEPWLVAAQVFAPCYIGGWSACEHWDLTEQIFRSVVVISAAATVRERRPEIQGTQYLVKIVPEEKLFGTRSVWTKGQQRVLLSDPTRTLVDILDDPRLGGGIRHVAGVLSNYFESEHRDEERLLDYAERLGNRTIYKRLGSLVETLAIHAPALVAACRERMSSGYTLLDPTAAPQGPLRRRWQLRLNVRLPAAEDRAGGQA